MDFRPLILILFLVFKTSLCNTAGNEETAKNNTSVKDVKKEVITNSTNPLLDICEKCTCKGL